MLYQHVWCSLGYLYMVMPFAVQTWPETWLGSYCLLGKLQHVIAFSCISPSNLFSFLHVKVIICVFLSREELKSIISSDFHGMNEATQRVRWRCQEINFSIFVSFSILWISLRKLLSQICKGDVWGHILSAISDLWSPLSETVGNNYCKERHLQIFLHSFALKHLTLWMLGCTLLYFSTLWNVSETLSLVC